MIKYIECHIPTFRGEEEFTKQVFDIAGLTNGIMMPFYALHIAEKITPPEIKKVVPIDHPLGMSDGASRLRAAQAALNCGANVIDLAANTFLLKERKKDFNKDIKALSKLCEAKKAELRVTIDYREIPSTSMFVEYWKMVVDAGVDLVCPSNGFFVDDFCDNLMMCDAIESKYGIRTICTGNLYRDIHFDMAKSSSIYGLRILGSNCLKRFCNGV